MNINAILVIASVTLSALLIGVSTKIISKRETDGQLDTQNGYLPSAEKRPFCNAFTGCGKKRSNGYEIQENREPIDPLKQLSRRLVKEAKQWELLQNRFNHNEMLPQDYPLLDYLTARKKRSVDSNEYMKIVAKSI